MSDPLLLRHYGVGEPSDPRSHVNLALVPVALQLGRFPLLPKKGTNRTGMTSLR